MSQSCTGTFCKDGQQAVLPVSFEMLFARLMLVAVVVLRSQSLVFTVGYVKFQSDFGWQSTHTHTHTHTQSTLKYGSVLFSQILSPLQDNQPVIPAAFTSHHAPLSTTIGPRLMTVGRTTENVLDSLQPLVTFGGISTLFKS